MPPDGVRPLRLRSRQPAVTATAHAAQGTRSTHRRLQRPRSSWRVFLFAYAPLLSWIQAFALDICRSLAVRWRGIYSTVVVRHPPPTASSIAKGWTYLFTLAATPPAMPSSLFAESLARRSVPKTAALSPERTHSLVVAFSRSWSLVGLGRSVRPYQENLTEALIRQVRFHGYSSLRNCYHLFFGKKAVPASWTLWYGVGAKSHSAVPARKMIPSNDATSS